MNETLTLLSLQNGRHALQEVIVHPFVPNDIAVSTCHAQRAASIAPHTSTYHCASLSRLPMAQLSSQSTPGAVAIVTGANFSGKSVYLKQIGETRA